MEDHERVLVGETMAVGESPVASNDTDDSTGINSFQLSSSIIYDATERIRQSEENRRRFKYNKNLIPVIELFLPPNKSLKDAEDGIDTQVKGVKAASMRVKNFLMSCNDGGEDKVV
eukprot:804002_1